MSGQQSHRRTIYRPHRRSRHGKSLQKNKRSSPKIHPSNRSIHPNRLPRFYRSRLFRKYLQSHWSASRSRLAAANRPHLSNHHRRKLYQWSSHPPSARSRSQTPRRGNVPDVVFLFVQEIQSRSALQKYNRKRPYRKPRQSVHEKPRRRTHSEKCSKRATTARPEQPPQPRKSWRSRCKGGQGAGKRACQFRRRHGAFYRIFHRHCRGCVPCIAAGDSVCRRAAGRRHRSTRNGYCGNSGRVSCRARAIAER